MPTLAISDGAGNLLNHAALKTAALMLFPDDERAQFDYSVVYLAEGIAASEDEKVTVPSQFLRNLLQAPGQREMVRRVGRATVSGMTAGGVLRSIVSVAESHPEHASVLKAVEVLAALIGKAKNPDLSASPAFIKQRWSNYRSLAPLWASYYDYLKSNPSGRLLDEPAAIFLRFLAVAEWYRARGEAIIARGATKHGPVLDPATTWRAPSDLPLPELDLTAEEPAQEVMEVLRRYRDRKSVV